MAQWEGQKEFSTATCGYMSTAVEADSQVDKLMSKLISPKLGLQHSTDVQ